MPAAHKPRKMNRTEVAIARVAQVIEAGRVLVAYNALANEDATVGTTAKQSIAASGSRV